MILSWITDADHARFSTPAPVNRGDMSFRPTEDFYGINGQSVYNHRLSAGPPSHLLSFLRSERAPLSGNPQHARKHRDDGAAMYPSTAASPSLCQRSYPTFVPTGMELCGLLM